MGPIVFGEGYPSTLAVVAPVYVGITGMDNVEDEAYRWITQRGTMRSDGTFTGSRNVPSIQKRDGTIPTMTELRDVFGFVTTILWSDAYYLNAARVEYTLQHWLKEELHLPLGDRLHRVSGAGGFGLYRKWDADPSIFGKRTVKVFMVSSTKLPELLANGDLRVVPGPRDG